RHRAPRLADPLADVVRGPGVAKKPELRRSCSRCRCESVERLPGLGFTRTMGRPRDAAVSRTHLTDRPGIRAGSAFSPFLAAATGAALRASPPPSLLPAPE